MSHENYAAGPYWFTPAPMRGPLGCRYPSGLFKKDADAPDYGPIASANEKAAAIAKQAADDNLAFQKEQYEWLKPYVQDQLEIGSDASKIQVQQAAKADARGDEQYNQYQSTFRPIEETMAQEAMDYGSEADQARVAKDAGSTVSQNFESTRKASAKRLAEMGVNPNSGVMQAAERESAVQEAAARSAAMTGAATAAKDKGIALRAGAASFGRNQVNSAGQSLAQSTSTGSTAAGTAGAGINSGLGVGSTIASGYGMQQSAANSSIQANLGLGGLMNSSYQTQAQQAAANSAGIGQLIGTGATLAAFKWSSKKLKENKAPVSGEQALDGIENLDYEAWDYKPGVADEGRHIGPYAEDVNREFGDEVAPGGAGIDMISMQGVQGAAIKELAQRLEALERRSGYGMKGAA